MHFQQKKISVNGETLRIARLQILYFKISLSVEKYQNDQKEEFNELQKSIIISHVSMGHNLTNTNISPQYYVLKPYMVQGP